MERADTRMVRSRTSCSCPLDVWTEILLRVPADNLVQLKRVCKPWRELIEDRHFVEAHRDLHWPRINGILFQKFAYSPRACKGCLYYLSAEFSGYNNDLKLRKIPVPKDLMPLPPDEWRHWRVCDSYSELLLISQDSDGQLILYNFITRSIKRLPSHGLDDDHEFWDWKIVHNASTNGDMVVGLGTSYFHFGLMLELDGGNQIDSTSSWEKLPLPVPESTSFTRSSARNNGRLYWLILGSINSLMNLDLLSFDVAKKKFEVIRVCSCSVHSPIFREEFLFVSGGTFYYTRPLFNEIELWVMENLDGRPAWSMHYVIKNDPVSRTSSAVMEGHFIPSGLLGTKLIMILCDEHKIAAYDMSSEKFTSVVVDDIDDNKEFGAMWFNCTYDYVADQVNSLIVL